MKAAKSVFVGLLVLLLVGISANAQTWEGSLNGADYRIVVPENWNGTLLVYAHGYGQPAAAPVAPDGVEELLLADGYALAGSRYRADGWAVKEGLEDTLTLTIYFLQRVGTPERVLVWGTSMGGLITIAAIEKCPWLFDGGIATCAVAGGATKNVDARLGISLAYDVTFGWPAEWGTVGNVSDDLINLDDYWTSVWPIVAPQMFDPDAYPYWEFLRLVNDLPEPFYDWSVGYASVGINMWAMTVTRGEAEVRAGGPVAQNLHHCYSLEDWEKEYLAGLGVDADALLGEMNARTTIEADRLARKYVKQYYTPRGRLRCPLLTLHTTVDGLVPSFHQSAYRETVEVAGCEDKLVQVFTDAVGHCAFSADQLVTTLEAMEHWLETGTPPEKTDAFFPTVAGFDNAYEPPPYPHSCDAVENDN